MKRISCWVMALLMLTFLIPVRGQAAPPEPQAKSALLMEVSTGRILYEHNAREALPPASVTKIMTLLLVLEAIDSGRLRWEDPVTASESAAAKGGSQIYLRAGETMPVSDLVKSIAVSSANDAACAMAEHLAGSEEAFAGQMNDRARELGMEDTHFVNCTGLDDSPEAKDHKTSARDIALMSRELLKNHPAIKDYTTIWMDTVRGGTFGLSNTNKLIRFYPGATGLKTGFTASAGYCLSATAEREGMELIAVVMGCASSQERNAACKALLDYGFANYALVSPQLEDIVTVPVVLGRDNQVPVVPADGSALLIDKSQRACVTTELTLEPSVRAPVSRGQALGTMTVRAGDQVLQRIPLTADRAVEALTFRDLFLLVLRRVSMADSGAPVPPEPGSQP